MATYPRKGVISNDYFVHENDSRVFDQPVRSRPHSNWIENGACGGVTAVCDQPRDGIAAGRNEPGTLDLGDSDLCHALSGKCVRSV